MVRPKAQRRIQVEELKVSPSEPSCDISTKLIRPIKFLSILIGPDWPGGIVGSVSMKLVARGMHIAAISTVSRMVQTAQIHTGDLLQHPLLDMLNWAGLGCCLPGNWLSTSSGACKGPRRWWGQRRKEGSRLKSRWFPPQNLPAIYPPSSSVQLSSYQF